MIAFKLLIKDYLFKEITLTSNGESKNPPILQTHAIQGCHLYRIHYLARVPHGYEGLRPQKTVYFFGDLARMPHGYEGLRPQKTVYFFGDNEAEALMFCYLCVPESLDVHRKIIEAL